VLVERAGGESADVVDDVEERRGDDVGAVPTPDVALQLDAGVSVFHGDERSDAHGGGADDTDGLWRGGSGRERRVITHAA
jgi:hypothetical protein